MQVVLRVPIEAKDKDGNMHDVKGIEMGQSRTYIEFHDKGLSSNSIDYEFYIDGEKIDIYQSAMFNPYITANCFNLLKVEERVIRKKSNDDLPF